MRAALQIRDRLALDRRHSLRPALLQVLLVSSPLVRGAQSGSSCRRQSSLDKELDAALLTWLLRQCHCESRRLDRATQETGRKGNHAF